MKKIIRYCQALDLVNDSKLINEYEVLHKKIWPEIAKNIRDSGVTDMQIWRLETRLFMIMDVDDTFSFERSQKMAMDNPKVIEWEKKMWQYQVATPWANDGEKWVLMEKIFSLSDQP